MTLPPEGPDLPPDGMPPVAYALTPRTCDAYALVLEAVGIRFTVLREGTLYAFRVGAADAARAREAGAFVAIAHPAWSQLRIGDGRALQAAHAVDKHLMAATTLPR